MPRSVACERVVGLAMHGYSQPAEIRIRGPVHLPPPLGVPSAAPPPRLRSKETQRGGAHEEERGTDTER